MADVEEQVRSIKQQIDLAQRQKARAEVERDQALASAERARARLKEEFGVETPEEARSTLAELEQQLERTLSDAAASLERTNA